MDLYFYNSLFIGGIRKMSKQTIVVSKHNAEHGSLRTYVTGFALSIFLTISAYLLVVQGHYSSTLIVAVIIILAIVQFLIQMFFFLHLGKEAKPRWKLYVLIFMIIIVLTLVIGSIWIMNNLNYRMSPQQMNTYMNNQSGL
jgi:cytochrome o ubiquinol oxidase operon protein cyoD